MSKIPYFFDTPVPKYFRENGWMKNPNMAAFLSWAFARCSAEKRVIYHIQKAIELEPFEFIFGRKICSEETGLTENEVRGCIHQLNDTPIGEIIKKTTSKTTNKYTVYRWSLECFCKIDHQQNDQQTTSRPPADHHKLEHKNYRFKETTEPTPTPSESEEFEVAGDVGQLVGFSVFDCLKNISLTPEDQESLSREFSEGDLARAVCVLREYKKPPGSVVGFLKRAIAGKWLPKNISAVKFTLSAEAEHHRSEINKFKLRFIKDLELKDITIIDYGDHVKFGGQEVKYENDNFNVDIAALVGKFNLGYLVPKKQPPKVENIADLQRNYQEA